MPRHDGSLRSSRHWLLTVLAIAACLPAHSPRVATRDEVSAMVVTASEIESIASTPDTAIAFDSVARLTNVRGEYGVAIAIVRRQRTAEATPRDALAHHDITEVYQIVEGSGEFVSGGRIVGGAEMAATSRGVRRVVGPSIRGIGIEGGQMVTVGRGDIIVVPPDTPHGFVRLISPRIVYTVVRVDPKRRLERGSAMGR